MAIALCVGTTEARERSASAKSEFKQSNPCPSTGRHGGACPGYEIDHRRPLATGGADHHSNMQWLSKEQHKVKTRYERQTCVYGCGPKGGSYSYKPRHSRQR